MFAHGEQMQEGCREIPAEHLGRVCGRSVVVRGLIPQPPAHAWPGTACPPRSLLGGGLRDRDELQSGQPRRGRDTELPGKARVDHGGDARDRERGLGDVGGEDDLAATHVGEHAVLLLRRHIAEERKHRMPLSLGGRGKLPLAPHDLAHPRQEDEHMAGGGTHRLGHGRRDLLDQVPLLAATRKPDVDWKETSIGRDDRAHARPAASLRGRSQQAGHWLGGERRAHHDDAEIGAKCLTHADKQAKHQIHLNRALVKLVEHDRSNAVERDVVQKPPQHDPGRLDDEPGVAADTGIKPHLIAHLAAKRHVAEPCDLMGHRPGREPPRLQQDEPRRRRQIVEHRSRHEHRLAGAGGRRDHHRPGP